MKVVNKRTGESFGVYIGRPGPFGNPVELGKRCPQCGGVHTRQEGVHALVCSGRVLHERLERDIRFRRQVQALEGKDLGCWCAPADCHGDLYVDYLEAFGERMAIMGVMRDTMATAEQLGIAHQSGLLSLQQAIARYVERVPGQQELTI